MTQKFLISPHNDDVGLFAAFTAIRERPRIVVVLDSFIQPGRGIPGTGAALRRREDLAAFTMLAPGLAEQARFAGIRDDLGAGELELELAQLFKILAAELEPGAEVWIPEVHAGGHGHHNLVGAIALEALSPVAKVTRYCTYTREGKVTTGAEVPFESAWVRRKLLALTCYESQFHPATGCAEHFLRDQREYYA